MAFPSKCNCCPSIIVCFAYHLSDMHVAQGTPRHRVKIIIKKHKILIPIRPRSPPVNSDFMSTLLVKSIYYRKNGVNNI